MDIGKPVKIHNIPDPHRWERRYEPWREEPERKRNVSRPKITRTDEPIPAPLWPIRKKEDAEVEK